MKNLYLPIVIISATLFACSTDVKHTEETTVVEETIEEVLETPTVNNVEMLVEITYNGNPITVNNPYSSTGVGFCIKEVYLDREELKIEIDKKTFAVDVTDMGFEDGQSFSLKVIHEENCLPEVLTE